MLREAVIVLVVALVLASVLRAFVVQAFVIPSGSMEPTLQCDQAVDPSCDANVSDRVVASKLSTRFGGVKRGEVVVFADPANWLQGDGVVTDSAGAGGALRTGLQFVGLVPNDSQGHLIKRVIGVGGDHIQTDDQGLIRVNGTVLQEGDYLKAGAVPSLCSFDVTVPADEVFVLGDNRSNSGDSRYHLADANHGMVPVADVTGRAVGRVWPLDRIGWLGVPDTFGGVPATDPPQDANRSYQAPSGMAPCQR